MAVGVLDPRKGIVWQDDGSSLTPEQIEQLQALEVRRRMGGVDTSPVNHWSQGAARVVDALGGVLRERRLANAASENQAYNAQQAAPLIEALSGGSPVASAATSAVSQELAATSPNVSPDIRSGIIETANALGIDPVDLGTAISYETAGTFDPTKTGPTTQWGQHKGLIQFGEPQAKQYGVDWNNPVGSQLGPNGAVANYLRSTGVKPGMGLMDIYSAINAGSVGRYGASDANNGGAPGTVADKVNQQMGGHRAKALALLGDYGNAGNPEVAASYAGRLGAPFQPQTASQAIEAVAPSSGYVDPVASVQPQAMAPELPAPTTINSAPAVAPAPAQVAQAQPQANSAALAQALRVMADPRANQGTRAVAQALIQRQQAQEQAAQEQAVWQQRQEYERAQQVNDPLYQLKIRQAEQELAGGSRQSLVNAGDGRIYDPNAKEWITAPDAASRNFRQATPDEVKVYGTNGQVGPDGRFYPITPPQGTALSVDPNTGAVTFNQGAGVKPLTEGQSKDSFFTTRMTAALPSLEANEQALLSLGGKLGEAIPMNLGNYTQSEEYQLARDAGRDFVTAYLRKDSGAALTPSEEKIYGELLLPQPGDKPATIELKRQRRQVAVEAIKSGMPPQALDGVVKAIKAVPGSDQPMKSNRTSSGVEWSID